MNQRNTLIEWADGHDHSDQFVVVRRADIDKVSDKIEKLLNEVTKLVVVASLVEAVEAAVDRAREGHGELNEQVLASLVKTYRKVLDTP